MYGENKLQKTITLPTSATVTDAKKIGSEEILKHLRLQPGVPSAISIDDECTDFYPGMIQSRNVVYILLNVTSCSGYCPNARSEWSGNNRAVAESCTWKYLHAIPYHGCTQ